MFAHAASGATGCAKPSLIPCTKNPATVDRLGCRTTSSRRIVPPDGDSCVGTGLRSTKTTAHELCCVGSGSGQDDGVCQWWGGESIGCRGALYDEGAPTCRRFFFTTSATGHEDKDRQPGQQKVAQHKISLPAFQLFSLRYPISVQVNPVTLFVL